VSCGSFHHKLHPQIQRNFVIKFCTSCLLLSVILAYDGYTRDITHYMAYAVINFFCAILVYKEIVREWEQEMRKEQFVEALDGYEKIGGECTKVVVDEK
jgi:uncharacterized membrane protein